MIFSITGLQHTFSFATFQQSDAPQKPKRSLKGVSQKMATMSRVDMNKKEVKPSQLNTGMIKYYLLFS